MTGERAGQIARGLGRGQEGLAGDTCPAVLCAAAAEGRLLQKFKVWPQAGGFGGPASWFAAKAHNMLVQVEAELEEYKKSGDKYLDRVDFLKRAELRQYEKERDERLGADIRTRGRL